MRARTYSGHQVKLGHVLHYRQMANWTNRYLVYIMTHPRINMNLKVKILIIHLMKKRMVSSVFCCVVCFWCGVVYYCFGDEYQYKLIVLICLMCNLLVDFLKYLKMMTMMMTTTKRRRRRRRMNRLMAYDALK